MKTRSKKLLALFLSIAMCLSMLPSVAFAADTDVTAWTKVSLDEITAEDTIAITMSTADGDTYALPTVGGGAKGQPLAVAGTVTENTLTTIGTSADCGWTLTPEGGGYSIQADGKTFYTEAANDGLRIGDGSAIWTLDEELGYLFTPEPNGDSNRYLGVYEGKNGNDWRTYKLSNTGDISNNIKDEKLGFWKFDPNAEPTDPVDPPEPTDPVDPPDPTTPPEPSGTLADLVTEVGDGSRVYIYHPDSATVLTAEPSGAMLASTEGILQDGQLVVTEGMAELTITEADGGYTFQNGSGEYLTATGFNKLSFEAEAQDSSKWNIESAENGFYIKNLGASTSYMGLEYYQGNYTAYRFIPDDAKYLFQFYAAGEDGFTDALAAGDSVVIYNPVSGRSLSNRPTEKGLEGTELSLSADDRLSGYSEADTWTVGTSGDNFTFSSVDGQYLNAGQVLGLNGETYSWGLSKVPDSDQFTARGSDGKLLKWNEEAGCWDYNYYANPANVSYLRFYKVSGSIQPSNVVAAPKATPKPGKVEAGTEISFDCGTTGADISYQLNGGEWTAYTSPIAITEDSVFTVKATKEGMEDSREVSFTYTIYVPPVLGDKQAKLVTDVSELSSGDLILIVTKNPDTKNDDKYYALGTSQKENNRGPGDVIKVGDKVSYDEFAQIITLESGVEADTFALYATNGDTTGYLYAPEESGNLLRTQSGKDLFASFTIEIEANGTANITAKTDKKPNTIRFNSIGVFSCYGAGGQNPVEIYKLDGQTRPGMPNAGDQVVIYNQAAKGVLSGMEGDSADVNTCKINSSRAVLQSGKADCANGAVIYSVEKNGDYYRFRNESFGYLCSTGNGNNAFYSKTASDDADWMLEAYNGGYRMGSRTAKFSGNTQYLQYFAGSFVTYGMHTVTDRDIYTYSFYPCANDKITDGVVNAPQAMFGTPAPAYAGQNYVLHFTVDALFGVKELKVTLNEQELEYTTSNGRYTVTIPAGQITGAALCITVTGLDNKNVSINSSVEIEIKDEPGISQVSPVANAQTKDDKRPEISAVLTNVGVEPTVVMTVNGQAVKAVLEGGVLSYIPAADLPDGRVTVTVAVTRADGKSASKTWNFTVGTSDYQLYFGQLHSHNGEYSDGSGDLATALDYIGNLPEEANVDFVAFTDHSNYFDKSGEANPEGALYDLNLATEYSQERWTTYKSTIANFNSSQSKVIAIPGFEMTWSGGPGHMNTFATEGIVSRNNTTLNSKVADAGMRAYYALLSQPEGVDSITQFNHPGNTFGNFTNFDYWNPEADSRVYLVEVGNGEGQIGSSGYFPSYEQYNLALDKGWHLAPTNNQDNHKGKWGNANEARDVVLVEMFSEEGIYDAIRNYRVYSTEDRNLEVNYMVNDLPMGTIIETVPDKLKFDISVMDPDDTDSIVKVELIVNSGKVAYTWDNAQELAGGILTVELSPEYSYYYVRVTQEDGDLAVTAPVWVGEGLLLGISEMSSSASSPVTGEEISIATTLYNSEDYDALVKSVTYTTNGSQVLWTDNTDRSLAAGSTLELTWKYTPTASKLTTIAVTVVVELNGKEYTYSSSVELDVLDEASLGYIGIDASHGNEYVSGYNKDLMNNFITLANESVIRAELLTTSEALIAACSNDSKFTAIVLNAPSPRLNETKDYSEAELTALAAYRSAGGTVIITGAGDVNDKEQFHVASTQNKVLEALGSSLRLSDDDVYEAEAGTPGLKFDSYGESALTAGLDGNAFSYYGGSSIYAVDGQGGAALTLPGTVVPLLYANSTTASRDGDSDDFGADVVKYPYVQGDERILVMAMEQPEGKGMVLVAGTAFMNDFEVLLPAQNANNAFCKNLFEALNPVKITPIAEVNAQKEPGYRYTIEGVVTSNASGYDQATAFFDCIYVQDETGGINCFPISGDYKLGDVVRITGFTDAYQEEPQIKVRSTEKVGETEALIPTVITAAQLNDRSLEGRLVTVKGSVVKITLADGQVESIYVQDASNEVARVFIDGYITADKVIENLEVGCSIEATGLASYDNTYVAEYGNYARIRVRDRAEILCTASSEPTVSPCSHTRTEIRNAKEATCTQDGYTGDKYCKSCGRRISKGTIIPATGHQYVDGACTVCGDTTSMVFTDVHAGNWYYGYVVCAVDAGLMNGVSPTLFAPDATLTRAQFATILYRYLDVDVLELDGLENPFTDLMDDWYKDAAIYLNHIGVVKGTSPSTFSPNDPITRETMVTMLYRLSGAQPSASDRLSGFIDGGSVSSFALDAMNWAIEKGLVEGGGNELLAPQDLASRAQAAKVICCFISHEEEK